MVTITRTCEINGRKVTVTVSAETPHDAIDVWFKVNPLFFEPRKAAPTYAHDVQKSEAD